MDWVWEEYERLTQAVVNAGVITHVLPFEPERSIGIDFRNFGKQSIPVAYGDEVSYANVYDNRQSSLHNLPFDTQFCKLLRYGLEESYIILLMALLPNIQDLKLWSAPYHPHSLRWRTTHGFKNLKWFTVSVLWDEQGN
jgi:hypothetical protein